MPEFEVTMGQTGLYTEAAVILPAYNEASRQAPAGYGLAATIDTYHKALSREYGSAYSLVVVNDGSTDQTTQLAWRHGAEVITYEQNRGRGHALSLGFLSLAATMAETDGAAIGYTDADGSYHPDTMLKLLDTIHQDRADVAVAYRNNTSGQHESLARRIAHSSLYNLCERIAPTGARDPQAGCKAIRARAVEPLWQAATIPGWAADREILHLAHKQGWRVAETGANITAIADSRVNPLRDAVRMVRDSHHIRQVHKQAVSTGEDSLAPSAGQYFIDSRPLPEAKVA